MLDRPPSVFVVDDDEHVRELIRYVLEEAGFAVTTAASGWAALDTLELDEFDLLVVDIGLADEFDGVDLIRCVRARRPRVRCLFISGYADPVTDDPDRDDFVRKPFRPHELVGCVWELLQRQVPEIQLDLPRRHERRQRQAARIACLRGERAAPPLNLAGTRRA